MGSITMLPLALVCASLLVRAVEGSNAPRLNVGEEVVLDTTLMNWSILRCEGTRPVTWSWDSPLLTTEFASVEESENPGSEYKFVSTLEVDSPYTEDTGYFNCSYSDGGGWAATYVYIYDGQRDFVNDKTTLVKGTTDASVEIDCRTTRPRTVVTLYREGKEVSRSDRRYSFDPRIGFVNSRPLVEDSAHYHCNTSNGLEDSTKYFQVLINPTSQLTLPTPTITTPSNTHFVAGHPFVLECAVAFASSVTFTWTKMPEATGPPPEMVEGTNKTKRVVLRIDEAQVGKDSGVYECRIEKEGFKSNSAKYHVNVMESIQPFINVTSSINIIRINETERVDWKCIVDAYPTNPVLHYYTPDGKLLEEDTRVSVDHNLHRGEAWLHFTRIFPVDFGMWTLKATTQDGNTDNATVTIHVGSRPQVALSLPPFIRPDEQFNMSCAITAYPPPDMLDVFAWRTCKDERTCVGEYQAIEVAMHNSSVRNVVTVVAGLGPITASAKVRCHGKNYMGERQDEKLLVVTDLDARWTLRVDGVKGSSDLSRVTVVVNDQFVLRCGASVAVFHSPELKAPGGVVTITNSTHYSVSVVTVGNLVTLGHAGLYRCTVQNYQGHQMLRTLEVEVLPERAISLLEASNVLLEDVAQLSVKGGDPFELLCDADGAPKPEIEWLKDGLPLESSSSTVLQGSKVLIRYFRQEDTGVYTCLLTRRGEQKRAEAQLYLKDPMSTTSKAILGLAVAFIVILIIAAIYLIRRLRREKAKSEEQKKTRRYLFQEGNVNQINVDLTAEEQADLLPYDKSFEVEKQRIKIGRQLGSGAFGRVVKAEVKNLREDEEYTVVAVKMCKSVNDPSHLRNLAVELKIMIHLGKHLNIVNLVGAHTSEIVKGELWLLVEYCKYGDLLSFLHRFRRRFVDQIDNNGTINYNILSRAPSSSVPPMSPGGANTRYSGAGSGVIGPDGYLLPNTTAEPMVLANPPKGRSLSRLSQAPTSPASPTCPGASEMFAGNPGYGILSGVPPSSPSDVFLQNTPQTPGFQPPPQSSRPHPSPSAPPPPTAYVNFNPSAAPGTPLSLQQQPLSPAGMHYVRNCDPTGGAGGKIQRKSSNRSTSGSVSTARESLPNPASSSVGSSRHVNTDMTTLTSNWRPLSPDAYLDSQGNPMNIDGTSIPGLTCPFTTTELICWSWQVAQGMEYLTARKILHGDLAARNLLLAEGNVIKISDFGLSRDMYKKEIYTKQGDDLLPIKWMSIEAIRDRTFSTESDIWAYGIVLWEVFSLGQAPYPGVDVNPQFLQNLENGIRNNKPKFSNETIYRLMLDCWLEEPESRPRFSEIRNRLGDLLNEDVKDNFSAMNDCYVRMNQDFFAGKTDYLSMFSPPDFSHIQKTAEDYLLIEKIDEEGPELSKDNYLNMHNTCGRSSPSNYPPSDGYLSMKTMNTAEPQPPDHIFSPNPVDPAYEEEKFKFHSDEDMPSKIVNEDEDSAVENSPSAVDQRLLQHPVGDACNRRDAEEDEHEDNSLLDNQKGSPYINVPSKAKSNGIDSDYLNI